MSTRLVPRTVAGQVALLQLLVVAVVVVSGSALAVVDARNDGARTARTQVTAVAVSLADAPSTAQALASPDPTRTLQPMAQEVMRTTGVTFITIMAPDRTRFTHANPAEIGRHYLGTVAPALAGRTFTETYTGTLGPSVRTIVPVRAPDGRIVGLVSVGITEQTLTRGWLSQLWLIVGVALAALVTAFVGLWLIRRRLLHQTGGLAPDDLRVMYEHHDAVLHAVREGLVVTEKGRPALINDEARRLLASLDGAERLPDFVTDGDDELADVSYAHGGRVLLVNRQPVPGRDGSAVVTIRDRTELSAAMGELDSMTRFAEALRSQAHESANRLHTITALIEMGRPEEAARQATTELELSQQLIDRLTESVAEPALAALLLGKTAQAGERGISFSLTEDSQLADSATQLLSVAELVTVVGNLVDNALDAADPADPWVEVTVVGDAEYLRVVVADSGPGMDEEMFERAKQRGYSTKSGGDAKGRGLGLALVAQVVSRHRGTLRAERSYGSVVVVELLAEKVAVTA